MLRAPWCDCKVAFEIENDKPFDDRELFNAAARCTGGVPCPLPNKWTLNEVDGTGARWVAVFRVGGVPTVEDGRAVKRGLRKISAKP